MKIFRDLPKRYVSEINYLQSKDKGTKRGHDNFLGLINFLNSLNHV